MAKSTAYLKKIKDLAAKNLAEGAQYLEENARKEGVVTLASGLQYKVIRAGTGPLPTSKSKILCHYKGMLLDGTVFDSSYKRKRPEAFFVHELIAGWQQALVLMPTGSCWQLTIPSSLAYGFESLTPNSGGNCTLIFEMEVLSIL